MGVFPIINRINHSCEPNCSVHWNLKTKREELFVMKSVEANTELTISYVDMISNASTRHERQEYLEKHFGFLCDCSLCRVSGEQLVHDNQIRAKVGVFFVTWWRNLVFLSGKVSCIGPQVLWLVQQYQERSRNSERSNWLFLQLWLSTLQHLAILPLLLQSAVEDGGKIRISENVSQGWNSVSAVSRQRIRRIWKVSETESYIICWLMLFLWSKAILVLLISFQNFSIWWTNEMQGLVF